MSTGSLAVTLSLLIPIVAIVGGISAGVFRMYFKYRDRQEFFKERGKLIDAMREAGEIDADKIKQMQDPELYKEYLVRRSAIRFGSDNLKDGMILLAVAVALWATLRFWLVDSEGVAPAIQTIALFPGLIGAVLIIFHFVPNQNKNGNDLKDKEIFP